MPPLRDARAPRPLRAGLAGSRGRFGCGEQRAQFARLYELRQVVLRDGIPLDTLSMGMSDDLEAAIAEGATIVRVGTAIFGPRDRR